MCVGTVPKLFRFFVMYTQLVGPSRRTVQFKKDKNIIPTQYTAAEATKKRRRNKQPLEIHTLTESIILRQPPTGSAHLDAFPPRSMIATPFSVYYDDGVTSAIRSARTASAA